MAYVVSFWFAWGRQAVNELLDRRKDRTKYESVVTTQHVVGARLVGTGGRHTHDTYVGVNKI